MISDPGRHRPDRCPQRETDQPLTGHGFYSRSLVDLRFDGAIRVRRYLCRACKRTISLLPEFALPWLRFSISVISLFLMARLFHGLTLAAAALAAGMMNMPYQRCQFWTRRFQKHVQLRTLTSASVAQTIKLESSLRPAGRSCCRRVGSSARRPSLSLNWVTANRVRNSRSAGPRVASLASASSF
jgi:hypothetical protein